MSANISNGWTLDNLTLDQLNTIKDELSFLNPKYESAMRFSRYSYTKIPRYVYYYDNVQRDRKTGKYSIDVPIGYPNWFKYTKDNWTDSRVTNIVKYPEFKLTLRDEQKKSVKAFDNRTTGIIQLPTGKGKTITALYLAQKFSQKTLVLVHKDDLVTGWKKDINLCFGDIKVGLIKAKSRVVGEHITIATVQTLGKMTTEELSNYLDEFGLLILDEAHHVGAPTFNIVGKFRSMYKIGLSATPNRSDGQNQVFTLFFGGIAYKYEYDNSDKDILPVKVITKESKYHFYPVVDNEGTIFNSYDFTDKEMPKNVRFLKDIPYEHRPRLPFLVVDNYVVTSRVYMMQVCHDILECYRAGKSIIAFFTQKDHIDRYFRYLRNFVGEDEILLYYGDNKEKSDNLLQKAESKECLITLATYAKATEGTNVKAWECAFLVSSLNNEKNVEQAIGRVRRSSPNKSKIATVYDYRLSDSFSIKNHGATRDNVYRRLKFDFTPKTDSSVRSTWGNSLFKN